MNAPVTIDEEHHGEGITDTAQPYLSDADYEASVLEHNAHVNRITWLGMGLTTAVSMICAGLAGIGLGIFVFIGGVAIIGAVRPDRKLTKEEREIITAEIHQGAQRAAIAKASGTLHETGRNLTALGVLLLFIGGVVGFLAMQADTTVATSIASNATRVHNLGLMHDQTMMLIIAGFLGLGGLILIGIGSTARR